TNLAITGTTGDRTLRFSATALTPAVSGTIALGAGAATQLTLTTSPRARRSRGPDPELQRQRPHTGRLRDHHRGRRRGHPADADDPALGDGAERGRVRSAAGG